METVEANAQQQLEDIVAPGEIFSPVEIWGKTYFTILFSYSRPELFVGGWRQGSRVAAEAGEGGGGGSGIGHGRETGRMD